MDFKQIKELIELMNDSNLSELKLKEENFQISIRTKHYSDAVKSGNSGMSPTIAVPMSPANVSAPAPVQPIASSAPSAAPNDATGEVEDANLKVINSPMIGTFYRSSSPDKDPFVKVGDTIQKGTVLCIVEAMKLFNEIESEVSGRIVKVLADDGGPVEYDQPLFQIEPI